MRKNISPVDNSERCIISAKRWSETVTEQDVVDLTQGKYSRSSVLAIRTDWNRFVLFCESKHVRPLPASVTAIRLFLEHESRDRKFATLRRYSITIGIIHVIHNFSDPTNHRQIKFTLQQLRLNKHGDAKQSSPLTKEHLLQLNTTLSSSPEIRDIRDLSIYFVMFECALKRSELKKLQIDNISLQKNHAVLSIGDNKYQLSDLACSAITKWIKLLYGSQGVLYRRIDKHSNIGTGQLDDSSIYRILRRASDLLGLPEHMKFNGQSARVGATKELQSQGYKLKDIQDFGRWMSPAMPAQYLEKTSTAEGEMARFRAIKPWS